MRLTTLHGPREASEAPRGSPWVDFLGTELLIALARSYSRSVGGATTYSNMVLGGQAAMVAVVAFGIGVGIGLEWGPFSSRRSPPTPYSAAPPGGVDADWPAMAWSKTVAPTPPNAPGASAAAPDAALPEATPMVRNPVNR